MSTNCGVTKTRVVNMRTHLWDVNISRPGQWGNPFIIGVDGTRAEVIEKYRQWIIGQPHLMRQLHILEGKRLGCFCHPLPCHGDCLVDLVEKPLEI